jgi:hypothetical protein
MAVPGCVPACPLLWSFLLSISVHNKVRYKSLEFCRPHTLILTTTMKKMLQPTGKPHGRALVLAAQSRTQTPAFVASTGCSLRQQRCFRGTTVIAGLIGEATGGVTEALRRRVVLPLAGPLPETNHVLGHELAHAFQYDVTSMSGPQGDGLPGAVRLPLRPLRSDK